MKKTVFTFSAITLCTLYGVLSWAIVTHSEAPTADTSDYAEGCQTNDANGSSPAATSMCCLDYHAALDAAKADWQENLQNLTSQEIAASDMVDDAYENLRTYNCWLEYICRAVQYSGHAPIESAQGTGLTSRQLGIVPGCQAPEDMRMERNYNTFLQDMKGIPIAGVLADAIEQSYVDNRVGYFPRCQTGSEANNGNPDIVQINSNYDACKEALELSFGCKPELDEDDPENENCANKSTAFVQLETVLKKAQADQKASALERKLGTIVPKLQAMEAHVGYVKSFLTQLNTRLSCYAPKCG